MPKVILRSNPKNNYTVESKIVDVNETLNNEKVELVISPVNNNTVDANDFSFGNLPSIISNINYYNTSNILNNLNKVVAVITFSEEQVLDEIVNINLPISGLSRSTEKVLILTDTTNVDKNVLVDNSSNNTLYSTDVNKVSKTYKIASSNVKSKVLTKSFSLPNGYIFDKEPNYSVNGSGFQVSINSVRDSKNRIIKKVFEVFYTFPKQNPTSQIIADILFFASSKKETTKDPLVAVTKDDYKIYNVDLGRKIGTEGGVKNITINGVPGTKFKVLVQDENKKLYDFKSGGFKTNAKKGFLEGTIPPAIAGFGYGTFIAFVRIEPSATVNNIKTHIQTLAPTKTTDLSGRVTSILPESTSEEVAGDVTLTIQCGTILTGTNRYSISRPLLLSEQDTLTDAVIDAGLLTDDDASGDDTVYTITAKSSSSISSYIEKNSIKHIYPDVETNNYTWTISVNPDYEGYYINILRSPKFEQSETYVEWNDSFYGGDTGGVNELGASGLPQKAYNSTGTEINTDVRILQDDAIYTGDDWRISGNFSVGPSAACESFQDPDGNMLHTQVVVSLNSLTGNFGTGNLTIDLNLDNFLRIKQNA